MRTTTLFAAFLITLTAHASPIQQLQTILKKVAQRSPDFKILEIENKSSNALNNLVLADFDSKLSLDYSLNHSDDPQTSPFSSDSTRQYDYGVGWNKLWQSGLNTSAEYNLTSNLTTFSARSDSDFLYPTLALSVETDLLADFLDGKQKSRIKEQKLSQTSIDIETKISQKKILIESLLSLADTLETRNNLLLQEDLCKETRKQNRVLRTKWNRKSISQRDYLLGTKDLNTCLISKNSLRTQLNEKIENLQTNYYLGNDDYDSIDVGLFFSAIVDLFNSNDFDKAKLNIDEFDNIISLQSKLSVSRENENQVNADLNPDLSFSLTGGVQGLDSQFGEAHSGLTKATFPYVLANVSISFPFKNRAARIAKARNSFEQEVLKLKIEKERRVHIARVRILSDSISRNIKNYEKLKENVSLSQRALKEAERDFNNGRINFQSLSEFNKGLIQSRQSISQQRSLIVVQLTEYFDYFQFFDRFFTDSNS